MRIQLSSLSSARSTSTRLGRHEIVDDGGAALFRAGRFGGLISESFLCRTDTHRPVATSRSRSQETERTSASAFDRDSAASASKLGIDQSEIMTSQVVW